MSKIPFEKFIITFLLFDKSIPYIVEKLNTFGYEIDDSEVSEVFDDLKSLLPKRLKEKLVEGAPFDLEDTQHVQWLKQFDVFEFYDFIIRKDKGIKDPPEYFKWCKDCLWVHANRDIMSLINIFLFNGEEYSSISNIIMFKYKKKIGVDALELYHKMFWQTEFMTAKEALYHCVPFRNNALIIRHLRSGEIEIETYNEEGGHNESGMEQNDGSDVSFTFHDSNYIKWKIGYKDIDVPTTDDFLEKVKTDSFYKYYEAMNMSRSVEIEEENGFNDNGTFDSTKIRKRNVEEQRVKMAKNWFEMYLKADKSKPVSKSVKEDFFEKMEQLELRFEEDKIALVEDIPGVLDDIKSDISNATI